MKKQMKSYEEISKEYSRLNREMFSLRLRMTLKDINSRKRGSNMRRDGIVAAIEKWASAPIRNDIALDQLISEYWDEV